MVLFIAVSIYGTAQKKPTYKLGVFGTVYRSDIIIGSTLKSDGKTKYFPSWDPIITGGFGISASMLTHKVWYNSLSIDSRTFAFEHELGDARYRFLDLTISSGIKYKHLKVSLSTGVGKLYGKVFIEGSSKDNTSNVDRNNFNKSIIIPIDFEITYSPDQMEYSLIFQTIGGELFPDMIVRDKRVYNYPYNIGAKCTFWIIK